VAEQAAPVHPGPEIGRDRDVGRGRDDVAGELAVFRRDGVQDLAEPFLRARLPVVGLGELRRDGDDRRLGAAAALGVERRGVEEGLQFGGLSGEARKLLPLLAVRDAHALLEARHLVEGHKAGMVVLMAREGQALALDRVGDEAGRRVVGHVLERVDYGLHVVAGQVGHELVQRRVVVLLEDAPHTDTG
jgi:hypothetical protein